MTDVSNLKINERSDMRIGKISSGAEYFIDEQLQNFPIF